MSYGKNWFFFHYASCNRVEFPLIPPIGQNTWMMVKEIINRSSLFSCCNHFCHLLANMLIASSFQAGCMIELILIHSDFKRESWWLHTSWESSVLNLDEDWWLCKNDRIGNIPTSFCQVTMLSPNHLHSRAHVCCLHSMVWSQSRSCLTDAGWRHQTSESETRTVYYL